ncbi:peptide chain release factor N(5)-glutamine methyltransferase [Thermoflexus sp.]|uniref:peptide chain release factor N(5)-glutamine methyltransferase n=1 Tax=Thermoflexus sp. TaxID=1969742 RepID=UPI00175803E8|nr:peptide chain release factor N(5)-glutamine methyltransferase [Thermoflexus sp.]
MIHQAPIQTLSIREAIAWAAQRVRATQPRLAAEVLLARVLGVSRAYLLAHPERVLTDPEWEAFARLVARSAHGEPLFYLIGEREFYGMPFRVTPAVLIPRPETEHLVDAALEWARSRTYRTYAPLTFADIGTGSGCIAVTLAVYLPNSRGYATDLSSEALEVARENAIRHGVAHRLSFLQGDLCAPLPEAVDLLVANLPYVARSEWEVLDPAIREYEPILALDGGPDGLEVIRRFLAQAPDFLRPMGAVFLEIGAGQGAAVLDLARSAFPRAVVRLLKDSAGLDRVVAITH